MTPLQVAIGALIVAVALVVIIIVGDAKTWFKPAVGVALAVPATALLTYAVGEFAGTVVGGGAEGGWEFKDIVNKLTGSKKKNNPERHLLKTLWGRFKNLTRTSSVSPSRKVLTFKYQPEYGALPPTVDPSSLKHMLQTNPVFTEDFMIFLEKHQHADENLLFLQDLWDYLALEPNSPDRILFLEKLWLYVDKNYDNVMDINLSEELAEKVRVEIATQMAQLRKRQKAVMPTAVAPETQQMPNMDTWNKAENEVLILLIQPYTIFRDKIKDKPESPPLLAPPSPPRRSTAFIERPVATPSETTPLQEIHVTSEKSD